MMNPRQNDQPGGATPSTPEPRYGNRPRGGPPQGEYEKKPPQGEYEKKPPQGEYEKKPPQGEYEKKPSEYAQKPSPDDPTYPPKTPPKEDYDDAVGEPGQSDDGTAGSEGGFGPVDESQDAGAQDETADGMSPKPAHPCPPSMTCNTGAIDDLQCEAKGVKAESDALAGVAAALDTRRTAFETARGDYSTAREQAAKDVKDLDGKLECIMPGFKDKDKAPLNRDEVECLDKAFAQVLECLDECPEDQGCCVCEDCGFDSQTWTVGQIDDLRGRVEKVEKCFDEVLVKEPEALKTRVEEARKLVDTLKEDMDKTPRDAKRLYARALEARRALEVIWGRFKDVNEFQNCLCRGFTCSLKGRKLLAQLAGDQAYQWCQEESRRKRCDWLRKNMVEETLATALVICPPGSSSDSGEQTKTDYQAKLP
jgi:hypothetical protein